MAILLISVLFILITDYMVKKGRIIEMKSILLTKIAGTVLLFIAIGFLIAGK